MFLVRLSTLLSKFVRDVASISVLLCVVLFGCSQYTPVALASLEVEGSWVIENALRDMVKIDPKSPYRLYVKCNPHQSQKDFFVLEKAALDLKGLHSRQIVEDSVEVKLMRGEEVVFVHNMIIQESRDSSSNESMLAMYVADRFSTHVQEEFASAIYQDVQRSIYHIKVHNNEHLCINESKNHNDETPSKSDAHNTKKVTV